MLQKWEIINWYLGNILFLFLFNPELKDDNYVIPVILYDIQDQRWEHKLSKYFLYSYSSQIL